MKENIIKRLMVWFLLAVLFLPAAPSWAADGDIDTTFGTGGRVTTDFGPYDDEANAVAIQADDKIVAAGTTGGTDRDFALARYNTDGTLDTTFGTGGKVTTDFTDIRGTITTWGRSDSDNANAVAIQSDGKIVAAGTAGVTDFALARYNTDGTLDTTFGTGGRVTTYSSTDPSYFYDATASAVAIQSDGKIVVAGYAYNSDQQVNYNQYDFALARFNTDGTFDSTFGTGGIVVTAVGEGTDYDYAYAVAIQTDGKIVAAGATGPRSNYGGTNDKFALVRYNTNGTLDTSFGTGGTVTTTIGTYSDAYAIAIQTDGKIVATGYAYKGDYADFALARYNTDGTLDTSFGTDGAVTTAISDNSNVDNARAVAIQTDGKIVAAGIDSTYYFALVRYNTDGTLDTTFGTGGMVTTTNYDKAYAVAIQSDGKIVAAGHGYSSSSYYTDFVVVRYLTGAATPTPTPQPSPTPLSTPSPTQGGAGIIFGFINDADDNALQGVTVTLDGADSSESVTTDEEGYFEFRNLSAGDYTLTCEKDGYETYTLSINLGNDEIQEIETIVLEEVVKADISGYVVDIKGDPIENVRIKAKGVKTGYKNTATSDADGFFEFPDLEAGTYVLIARKKGYNRKNTTVKLGEGESEEVAITLKKTGKRIIKASAR